MKNKNKVIWIILILIVVFSLSLKFKKYIVDQDYFVYMHIPCQEGVICFEGEEQTYLKLYKKASQVKFCIDSKTCDPLSCAENEVDCDILTCSEENLDEEETCIEPTLQ